MDYHIKKGVATFVRRTIISNGVITNTVGNVKEKPSLKSMPVIRKITN